MAIVLMTGATGLIGSWVTALWPQSVELVAIGRMDADLTDADVFSTTIARVRPAAVLHLAWSASGDPGYRSSADNDRWLTSTLAAARTCLDLGARFIGTGTVVDDRPGVDAYSTAKYRLRSELKSEIDSGDVTWLRPFHVFDPDRGRPALMAAIREARSHGMPVVLETPMRRHDFILAADVGAAIVATLEGGLTGCVEIGSGTTRSVAEVVEALGASWLRASSVEDATENDSPARIEVLRSLGWSPVNTERLFADG